MISWRVAHHPACRPIHSTLHASSTGQRSVGCVQQRRLLRQTRAPLQALPRMSHKAKRAEGYLNALSRRFMRKAPTMALLSAGKAGEHPVPQPADLASISERPPLPAHLNLSATSARPPLPVGHLCLSTSACWLSPITSPSLSSPPSPLRL